MKSLVLIGHPNTNVAEIGQILAHKSGREFVNVGLKAREHSNSHNHYAVDSVTQINAEAKVIESLTKRSEQMIVYAGGL